MFSKYYLGLGDKGTYGIYIINVAIVNTDLLKELHNLRDEKKLIGHIHRLVIPNGLENQFLLSLSNFFPDLKRPNEKNSIAPLCGLYKEVSNKIKKKYEVGEDSNERYSLTRACLIKDIRKKELDEIFCNDNKKFNGLGIGSYINYPIEKRLF